MIANYLKIAYRNIFRNKGYSLINITGLAIGIACFILIMLYVQDELSYDRYHERADRIYRLERKGVFNGLEFHTFITAHPMAPALVADFPEIAAGVRFYNTDLMVRNWNHQFFEEEIFFTDSEVFQVFDFPLLSGDPSVALREPNSIVITPEMARKYFGSDDVLGKTLEIQWEDQQLAFNVTGILQKMPANSHFHAGFLASYATLPGLIGEQLEIWVNNNISTYLLLTEGATPEDLYPKFPDFIRKYMGDIIRKILGPEVDVATIFSFELRPITAIHLHSNLQFELEPSGSIAMVYTFSAIALFMLLIAAINFMNLATARSARRAREVGIRKVVGANRKSLVAQFLGESLLLAYLAALLAVLAVALILSTYNAFILKELTIGIDSNPLFYPGLFAIVTLVGLLAGSYPALFLSAYQPVQVLKGSVISARGGRTSRLRQGLVILQFAISIALILGTLVVSHQLDFLQNKRLGFTKEQVVVLNIQDNALRSKVEMLKTELKQDSRVISVAGSSRVPGNRGFSDTVFRGEDSPEGDVKDMTVIRIDQDFLPTMEIDLLAGRNFARDFAEDWKTGIILNELAAREFGWNTPQEALGKIVYSIKEIDPPVYLNNKVVGITDNFHFKSLHHKVEPLLLHSGQVWGDLQYLSVRIGAADIAGTLEFLKNQWQRISPDYPFDYFFLDENFGQQYQAEQRTRTIFRYFTAMTIFIACLGLLGLASFTTEQRTKEIGIRKTLGASVPGLTTMLCREFVILVVLANLIALPAGWYLMSRWLESFAYRMTIGVGIYVTAALIAVTIALVTVIFQAFKAALSNPVNALKYE
ncbi:MAG: ABC transporter permease [Candidatus Neomarinimicrobiota bacterium]